MLDLDLIGRSEMLFSEDLLAHKRTLYEEIEKSSILIIGAAGSIGQAVSKEVLRRNPAKLHVVDISENNMVELVREIRSTIGYIKGEFKTFCLDCGSIEFEAMASAEGPYDYVFNLSALKHVRSERDPYTLMRMLEVNIFNTVKTLKLANKSGTKKYFCVSTDKAANPVNLMGASKRIMEMFLMRESLSQNISMARFANVAFSDGSLLYGFKQRLLKKQPLSAPDDVKRYFVTAQESGELCLLSGILGENRDIYFPKLSSKLHLISFSSIARKFLLQNGYEPVQCESEEEARNSANELINKRKWPVYFFNSDTTGEKMFEEFFTESEDTDLNTFKTIGIIKNMPKFDRLNLDKFYNGVKELQLRGSWNKHELVELYHEILPELNHKETSKFLDERM